jgi:MSHA biogenesis protein MshI
MNRGLSVLARFRRQRAPTGWIALATGGTRCRLACVSPGDDGRPRVRWTADEPWDDPFATLRGLKERLRAEPHRLVLLLQRGQYQLLPMEAPAVPPEDWRQAARWQIRQMVDYPVESASIDILAIPAHVTQRGQASLITVAAPREPLQRVVDAAQEAGLPLSAIDIPETALRNICGSLEEPGRGQALLHLGETHSALVVTAGGELLLARSMDVSLAQLTHDDADIRQQAFERASLELQRTLDSVERVFNQVSLSRVLVAPAAAAHDFLSYVRDLVYVPVLPLELGDVLDLSDVPAFAADPLEQARGLVAIGGTLRPGACA